MSVHDEDVENFALPHQITILERQLKADRARFAPEDRAWPAALLTPMPRAVLRGLRLLVRPDTVLRRHRDLSKTVPRPHVSAEEAGPTTHGPLDPHADLAHGPRTLLGPGSVLKVGGARGALMRG
ncbi:hypothetical protein [Streptomyces sp. NPDC050264]|uniref:hypothetical protein n=1 Tax=Streptomyces sp. NPDC050264 TaxID=3155038 RepID=UPI003431F68A